MKKCSGCGSLKNYNEFHKNNTKRDRHSSYCKTCSSEYYKKNYKKLTPEDKRKQWKRKQETRKRKLTLDIENAYLKGKIEGYKEAMRNNK